MSGLCLIDHAPRGEDVRKPIVSTVYAVSCALAVCGGFLVANTTHSATPENAARHVEGAEEELFGLVDNPSIRPSRAPDVQVRPQPGLHSPPIEETSPPERSDSPPREEAENPPQEPAVSPAGSGQSSLSGSARSNPGQFSPAPPQRLPNRPEPRPAAPPPAPEPLAVPDIPFPTLTINQLPVNPPKPEPLRPLRIG